MKKLETTVGPVTLDQLAVFIAVCDHGSFSRAAKVLGRAQSALSYAVATLERQLGVSLFDRRSLRPRLTDAGASLVNDARIALRDVDRIRARAFDLSGGTEPHLSIAFSVMFPEERIIHAVDAFRAHFPSVSLELYSEALGGVARLVMEGVCSIGVSEPLPPIALHLERKPLGSVSVVYVVAAHHPLAEGTRRPSSEALEAHVQLVLSDRSRLTEGINHNVLRGPVWRLADLGTKHAFLRAGFGWGGMPEPLVREDLEKGTLVELFPSDPSLLSQEIPLYFVHRASETPGKAARWLQEALTLCPTLLPRPKAQKKKARPRPRP